MIKISIITITFNNFEDLVKTCESIPENEKIEHIVVNGGTCEKTKNYLSGKKNIIAINEKDEGISDAFNKGYAFSKGEYIWYLNSGDILVHKGYIDFIHTKIGGVDFIHANLLLKNKNEQDRTKYPTPNAHLLWGMPYLHPTMVVRKEVFKTIGLFDIKLKIAMDLDFLARMFKSGFTKNAYYPYVVVEMDGNGVSNSNLLRPLKENIKVIRKNFGWELRENFELAKIFRSMIFNKSAKALGISSYYEKLKEYKTKAKNENFKINF